MAVRKKQCRCGRMMTGRAKVCRECYPATCEGKKASRARYAGSMFTLLEYEILRSCGVDATEMNRWENERWKTQRLKTKELFKRMIGRDPWLEPLTSKNREEVDKKLFASCCKIPFLCLRAKRRELRPFENSVCDNCKLGIERIMKLQELRDIRKIA